MSDYYEILGVTKSATDPEIKTAYRKQALKWHPDRNKSPEAATKFKEINKAFEVLSDKSKRQMYDQYGADAFNRGQHGAGGQSYSAHQGPFTYTYSNIGGKGNPFENVDFGGFSDPFEIFEQFFGFQSPFGGGSNQRRRRDVYEISLTFDEAVKGTKKETVIKGDHRTIKIPAGVDNGNRIRFADFDLQVNVKSDPNFKRDGQDLYLEKQIDYPLAVLGGVVDIPTIDGEMKLKIRPGTQSGTTVRLRGQGVVYPNSTRRGDQYVVYKVKIPERISSKGKRLLEDLQEELE